MNRPIQLLALVLPALVLPAPAGAQVVGDPILVVNVAGVDRVVEDVTWVFESAERPDLVAGIDTVLEAVDNLKGIDRTKPLGVLGFLAPTVTGQPVIVGYVPVTDLDQLMASLTVGPIRPERVPAAKPDGPTRWRIAAPDQPDNVLYLEARDGYAWIAPNPELLDSRFPDPVRATAHLTERYDVAASVNMSGIPAALRFVVATFMRTALGDGPPREPGESDERYAYRKQAVEGALDLATRFVGEGRDVTWGLEMSKRRRDVRVEVAANALPETTLAKSFEGFRGVPSRFVGGVLAKNDPFRLHSSWCAGDELRTFLAGGAALARREALAGARGDQPPKKVIEALFDVLDATIADGHADVAASLRGSPPGSMLFLAGIGIDGGGRLDDIRDPLLDAIERSGATILQRDLFVHRGVTVHEFAPDEADENLRPYGREATLLFGHGEKALWLALGGPRARKALESAIDAAAAYEASDESAEDAPVLEFDAAAATLMLLASERDPDFEALAQRAFLGGGDRVRVTLGPKPNGVALRVTLGEGWVRLLGLGTARTFDGNG